MKNYLIVFAMALAAAGARGDMATGTISGSSPMNLNGGTVYTVSGNVTINAPSGQNAITVKSGGSGSGDKVVIDIPQGCSLTVKGGDGSGKTGGGAGIYLPSGMTLYVTGKGTLTATGGKAGNGGNGSGDQTARARFSRGGGDAGGAGAVFQPGSKFGDPLFIRHQNGHQPSTKILRRAKSSRPAMKPPTMSSSMMPSPPGAFSQALIGHGLRMSKKRKRMKHAMK